MPDKQLIIDKSEEKVGFAQTIDGNSYNYAELVHFLWKKSSRFLFTEY